MPSALEKAVEIVLSGATKAKKSLGVGQAVAGVDNGAGEAGGAGLALSIQTDEGGVGEALFVRAEGAEAVRKAGREHGDDPVDEVDAVGAFAGFVI